MFKNVCLVSCLVSVTVCAMAGEGGVRTMKYVPSDALGAKAWQETLRGSLMQAMHLQDLAGMRSEIALEPSIVSVKDADGFSLREIRLRSTSGRMMNVVLATPVGLEAKRPAVVCIHGHGGDRLTSFDASKREYKCFGTELAKRGFVVISTDVGQHEVYEGGRTLMGERLWDLTRCVDYLMTLPDVDADRIGCAGLSLGGEMAMWLGAMDERVKATVSAGFLTVMDQMEHNHCMCWKFNGLRELVDFADVYVMIAPRALQCQNGEKEPETQFTPALARKALAEIEPAYRDLGAADKLELMVHEGGHEVALDAMVGFLSKHL